MPKRRKGTGVPFSWGMKDRDAGGQFVGKTDRVTGSQRPLSVQAETGTHEMGNGSRRVTAEPAEVREWRARAQPEFGNISARGGAKDAPIPRSTQFDRLPVARERLAAEKLSDSLGVEVEPDYQPDRANPDWRGMDAADERHATRDSRTRGYQTGLL